MRPKIGVSWTVLVFLLVEDGHTCPEESRSGRSDSLPSQGGAGRAALPPTVTPHTHTHTLKES